MEEFDPFSAANAYKYTFPTKFMVIIPDPFKFFSVVVFGKGEILIRLFSINLIPIQDAFG